MTKTNQVFRTRQENTNLNKKKVESVGTNSKCILVKINHTISPFLRDSQKAKAKRVLTKEHKNVKQGNWLESLAKVVKFKEEYGHCNIPRNVILHWEIGHVHNEYNSMIGSMADTTT